MYRKCLFQQRCKLSKVKDNTTDFEEWCKLSRVKDNIIFLISFYFKQVS